LKNAKVFSYAIWTLEFTAGFKKIHKKFSVWKYGVAFLELLEFDIIL